MTVVALAIASSKAPGGFAEAAVRPWEWGAFLGLIIALLVLDLLVVHRRARVVSFKEAALESAIWIAVGSSFALVIWWRHGGAAGSEYITGYLIEKSLSIDNVFVWAVIFSYFKVPAKYQFRTLFWGIFGALALRAVFIFGGVALINRFDVTMVIFGVILLWSAWKIAFHDENSVNPDKSLALRAVRAIIPSTTEYDGHKLFTLENARRVATPLFAVLILVETTDVLFAVDSIPAVLAVTRAQFIVFTSNAFAIMGLRSLYFCLNGMQDRFRYLNVGLGVILAFVGVKMLTGYWAPGWTHDSVPTWASLLVIALVLTVAISASMAADRWDERDVNLRA